MEKYNDLLNSAFSDIIKSYIKFQLQDHTKNTIVKGKKLIDECVKLLSDLKKHCTHLETILCDCEDFIEDVENDLSFPQPNEDFVYNTSKGMLSYRGRDYLEKAKKNIKKQEIKQEIKNGQLNNKVGRVIIPEIGYYLKINVVSKLSDIKPMFHYYNNENDKKNKPGVYCSIIPDIYIKVPFPTLIDSTKDYNRIRSVKCKNKTKSECKKKHQMFSKLHNIKVRECNYAHKDEKMIKIGYSSRCSSLPQFGNPQTLIKDIKHVNIEDIKNVLMYGLNDLFSSYVWFEYNNKQKIVLSDIDIV